MSNCIKALFLGDIFGQPGCRAVFVGLKSLAKRVKADLVIANAENAADGFGLTSVILDQLYACGVDVVTTGNHIWQHEEIIPALNARETLLRPLNYPSGTPGHGYCVLDVKGKNVAVLNAQGRYRLPPIDCPFRTAHDTLKRLGSDIRVRILDFHAEEAEEKEALAEYLDGSVSAVLGTHTHVQTADERILSGGTGYITDVGMTGPATSVIGGDSDISIRRVLTQLPLKIKVAMSQSIICGVTVTIDTETGKTVDIERIREELSV